MNPFHPPAIQPVQGVLPGALPKAIPAVQPLTLTPTPPNQAVPEGVEVPTQPFENNVMIFPAEHVAKKANSTDCKFHRDKFRRKFLLEIPRHGLMVGASPLLCGVSRVVGATQFTQVCCTKRIGLAV